MVANGALPGCDEANDKWPRGCQSWVSTTLRKRAARPLTTGTTSLPRGTASAPPGQKSFCTSTTMRTSSLPGSTGMLISTVQVYSLSLQPKSGPRLQAAIDLVGEFDQIVRDLDRIGGARLEPPQRFGQIFELALRPLPDLIERRRGRDALTFDHHRVKERFASRLVIGEREEI